MSSDSNKTRAEERAERAEERLHRQAERALERAETAEARVRERSEQAQERIAQALDRVSEAEDKAGQKVADAVQKAERAGVGPDTDAPGADEVEPMIWFRQEPASRRPAHTRADIARAALEIADSEGFDAVSMRRVAQRLGAGTMTLYHYVRNKDELITLMSDAVMAEVVVPAGELSDHWRTALTQIARRTHAAFAAHHWVFEQMGDDRIGPNGMRHFEQSVQAVASLDLDRDEVFELIAQVDDYVFGYSLREIQEQEEHERGWTPEMLDFLKRELATGSYPMIAKFFGDDLDASGDLVAEFLSKPGRFDRGLARLLDGIEAALDTRK